MNFKIYVVGEKIEIFYLEAIKEYEKRLYPNWDCPPVL